MSKTAISKISRPALSGIFPRKRLFRMLDSGRRAKKPVIWISGPAGSGKTTLVSSYIESSKLPCLWYQIDERDGDIASFFSFLGLAIKRARPAVRRPMPLFTPEYRMGVSAFSKNFFEETYRRLRPPFTIVFDNYQDAADDCLLHEVMASGLSVLPENLSVLILSRDRPHPRLARFRANGLMGLVGWDDIRFTAAEVKEVVRKRLPGKSQRMPAGAFYKLYAKTDGWIAGVILMLEKMIASGVETALEGENASAGIFDYFANEFFERAGEELRNFLLRTAFLPVVSAETAGKLAGTGSAARVLENLSLNHYFTTRRSGQGAAYQYHPLFRDFLRHRAGACLSANELNSLKKDTANLLVAAGQAEDAVELFVETGDWRESVRLIISQARSLVEQGRHAVLEKWIDAIPPGILENAPWLFYWKGVCRLSFAPPEGRHFFDLAFQLFSKKADETGELLSWSGVVEAIMMARDDFKLLDRWIDWLYERLGRQPSFPSPEVEAQVVSSMADALIWRRTGHPDTRNWVEHSLSLSKKIPALGLRLKILYSAIVYYTWKGDTGMCRVLADEVERAIGSGSAMPIYKIGAIASQAFFYSSFGEPETAIGLVAEGLELAARTGIHTLDIWLNYYGLVSALTKRDIPLIGKYLAAIKAGAAQWHYYHVLAWYNLLLDNLSEARILAEKSIIMADDAGIPFAEAWNRLILAETLLRQQDLDGAERALEAAGKIIAGMGTLPLEYVWAIVKATLAFSRAEETAGLEALKKAFTLGRQTGSALGLGFWPGSFWARYCSKAIEAGIEPEYARSIIKKLDLVPDDSRLADENWPWPLRIYTLGEFRIVRDGQTLGSHGKPQQKPLALLKILIAMGRRDIPEEKITDLLWPDAEGDLAHKSYGMALVRLRKIIGEKAVRVRGGRITLEETYCWTDIGAIEQAQAGWKRGGQGMEKAMALTEQAIRLYRGEFLPADEWQEWVVPVRERVKDMLLRLVINAGEHLLRAGQWEIAARKFEKGLEIDSLTEELYQGLMLCQKNMGLRARAARTYERCRKALSHGLGIAPSPATEDIYRSI